MNTVSANGEIKNLHTLPKTHIPEYLLCFSHLRWDFVFQRPQHLLTRLSEQFKVYYFEEPFFDAPDKGYLSVQPRQQGIQIVVPHLPQHSGVGTDAALRNLIDNFLALEGIKDYGCWYYTPMALSFSDHLTPAFTVYDCMDELAAFKFAPPRLHELELELLERADVVFTGGHSLYQAKKDKHSNIHAFPSSIDKAHFAQARVKGTDPDDQAAIPAPRLGFFGVIDERFDINLIREVADAKPDWNFVLIGPVVKIDAADLPKNKNIHYLGGKDYKELPSYLAGWDIATIPFALNESTRFISPTKTPEYLAAGIPVISTPIRDVVSPYGDAGLVHIAATSGEFIAAAETILSSQTDSGNWLAEVDGFLGGNSWDQTVADMFRKIREVIKAERFINQ